MEHILTTERLVLRPIEDKDKDDIIRGVSDFAVAKWLSMVPHPYTGSDAQWFIDHVKASPMGIGPSPAQANFRASLASSLILATGWPLRIGGRA